MGTVTPTVPPANTNSTPSTWLLKTLKVHCHGMKTGLAYKDTVSRDENRLSL